MTKTRILLCEDDVNLGPLLSEYLQVKGFEVVHANDGEKGLEEFRNSKFDFIILDVMMPKMDGFTLASKLRELNKGIPILFLTARSMKEDTLKGFKSGGDDYMTKPFSMEELILRINAILRRVSAPPVQDGPKAPVNVGNFVYDYDRRTLTFGEEEIKLTTKENQLFALLVQNKNGVMERDAALERIWGESNYFHSRTMDVYIAKIRKILKSDPNLEIINVHGKGFKLLEK